MILEESFQPLPIIFSSLLPICSAEIVRNSNSMYGYIDRFAVRYGNFTCERRAANYIGSKVGVSQVIRSARTHTSGADKNMGKTSPHQKVIFLYFFPLHIITELLLLCIGSKSLWQESHHNCS